MRDSGAPALAQRVVVITGAAKGQGHATAQLLARRGATVVMTDRAAEVVEKAQDIPDAVGLVHDVAERASWQSVVDAVSTQFGTVDGLVNNAGIYDRHRLEDTDEEVLQRILRVNQCGCFWGIQAVAPLMRVRRSGTIVNISSTGGLRGGAVGSSYAMTKWAIRGLTRSAAVELSPFNIRVNCVIPGLVATDMATQNGDDVNAELLKATPMARIGEPIEVAEATAFLLSDAASYMTGGELVVDGGLTA